jgi:FkbM family methyltransferase
MEKHPVTFTLGHGKWRARAVSLDSLWLAWTLFRQNLYARAMPDTPVKTVIDLGSNCGFFFIWLAARQNQRDLKGLAVEADPTMHREAVWHQQANQLESMHVIHGAVGAETGKTSVGFYLHPSTVGSTVLAGRPGVATAEVFVPCVAVGPLWEEMFPGEEIDVLKIDIEGAELNFLRQECLLLKRVKRVVVEVHEEVCPRREVEALLKEEGFVEKDSWLEAPQHRLMVFTRTEMRQ